MDQVTSSLASRTPAKSNVQSSNQQSAGSVTKRLSNELMTLMMSSSPGISAFPKNDGNLFDWVGTIEGPAGTVSFIHGYPRAPPYFKHSSLQDKWSAVYSVQTILLSLQSLLGEPNNASPLNPEAASLWDNPENFKTQLMKHYRPINSDSA
ncbi:hypothetical protein D9756_001752 [Leucocoprinus leucothites]|uniref:UBC core domain-containing protein n=1 Tax=Leucocoprinus leucothites TaxID=201217 RepID=A0A8H5G5E0_9AGAR|nr:hypothetical protein D9756_001752 [Leucoagaricus leucothites]